MARLGIGSGSLDGIISIPYSLLRNLPSLSRLSSIINPPYNFLPKAFPFPHDPMPYLGDYVV